MHVSVAATAVACLDKGILILVELASLWSREIQQHAAIDRGELFIETAERWFVAYHLLVRVTGITAIEALALGRLHPEHGDAEQRVGQAEDGQTCRQRGAI